MLNGQNQGVNSFGQEGFFTQGNNLRSKESPIEVPSITLPKGGGAIKSIDEKFSVNPSNGTAGFNFPFPFSPSRNGFVPDLSLNYNSGFGNSVFGVGWNAEPPSITRKTDRRLPQYNDFDDSDVFIFSGAEDLVPSYSKDTKGNWIKEESTIDGNKIVRYRPRIEEGFARIEKITEPTSNTYWKVTSRENVVSIFGKRRGARIVDPENELKIFKWLLEFSYDDKGNCFQYEYQNEDKLNIVNDPHEKNRLNSLSPCTNVYLKRIKYCNKNHFHRSGINLNEWEDFVASIQYLLELVLDYGDHNLTIPMPIPDQTWDCRPDPFSDYRAGFEIRTYRLCKRILMFHHFDELGPQPCLVRSLDFEFKADPSFAFLQLIRQKGYIKKNDGSYKEKSFPPFEFDYEKLSWNTEVKTLPKESLENLPVGLDDKTYQWIDLYGEGLSGIITEQAGAWYYKSNRGNGNFESTSVVTPKPSLAGLADGSVHFQDMEANAQKFLVSNDLNGYYEFSPEDEWLPFKSFTEVAKAGVKDGNVKMLDLSGDGRADILVSEEDVFVCYLSKGKEGFQSNHTVRKLFDEEKGPDVVFTDAMQSIFIADMNGDGLADIVRIRNGEIVYWPNLGFGKFGAKVTMTDAPAFDFPDCFNPEFLKLADMDGSGTTDLVYLGNNSFQIYFNRSGNSWGEVNIVQGINPLPFPAIDHLSKVHVVDLLGKGTGCIVWSSPLPGEVSQLRYLDLMDGKKPHILTSYKNNMGKEVSMVYQPSTFFYLQDKHAGSSWITKLPFPVHCVSEVEVKDLITKTRFTTQYSYHHGYYDYHEREFRGFGRVDQTDTETFGHYKKNILPGGSIQIADEGLHMPPVLTKTWIHTGAFLEKEKIFHQYEKEYFQNLVSPEKTLKEPSLPLDLTEEEYREAMRACKGTIVHLEVYSLDESSEAVFPYTTAYNTCRLQALQPKLSNQNGVFLVQESENLIYNYERDPSDPRIAHLMNIEVDEVGNVLKAAAVSYGRKKEDPDLNMSEQEKQSKTHILFTENSFTNKIDTASDYRLPVLFETLTYEMTGLAAEPETYFSINQVKSGFIAATSIAYHTIPNQGQNEKRLIEHVRTLFFKNDLTGPLLQGQIESLALPYQTFNLAFTPDHRDFIFGNKVSDQLLTNEGKFVHLGDNNYWIASGVQTFDALNFYQATEILDPFGFKTHITYDPDYHFFIEETKDELDNISRVEGFNYRTLIPYLLKDFNDNLRGIRTDELGMVISNFVVGKEGEAKGDFVDLNSVETSPDDRPTSMSEYDLFNYLNNKKPNFVKTQVRETHHFETIATGVPTKWQTAYSYSDGGGNEIMRKTQAEPGRALQENEDGTVIEVDTTPDLRWIGNGRTIINNKGKAVKQYEPYFSTTPDFEDSKLLVERGVTPIIHYDPLGRVLKTDFPNGTFSKVKFDSWKQTSYDQNDTVIESQWFKERIINPVPEIATPEEIAAANKAAAHSNTPSVSYLDSLGRNFLAVSDNSIDGKYKTLIDSDIEGNVLAITDPRGNIVMQYKYDMLGVRLYQKGADNGESWLINDVGGNLIYGWDSRNHEFTFEYDHLHRLVGKKVKGGDGLQSLNHLYEKIIYGEDLPDDKQKNLRGKASIVYDTAGKIDTKEYDFKGNPISTSRRLTTNYKQVPDWSNTNPDTALENEIFTTTITYDALNRIVNRNTPDATTYSPFYNEGGLLDKLEITQNGQTELFVKNIDYDEKGQRNKIVYGNDIATKYFYHKKTFQLIHLETKRINNDPLQDLYYTFDPVGNVVQIEDKNIPIEFFNNQKIQGVSDYTYDAIYQLKEATGREHAGQLSFDPEDNWNDLPFLKKFSANGLFEWRNYKQQYQYDEAGNILQMKHIAGSGSWTRDYTYELLSNRLVSTKVGTQVYQYPHHNQHGFMISLPHLQVMQWNFKEELKAVAKQKIENGIPETTYYVYDSTGQRARKVTERQTNSETNATKKSERIYIDGIEIYREYDNSNILNLERKTFHVMDDESRIAMIETRTSGSDDAPARLVRYQFGNHVGSVSLETDSTGQVISYEEYHPFGTTSYQAVDKDIKAAFKRYRFTGMERDDESGLEYHRARYYLPWLGRWLNADPIGIKGGLNLFLYSKNNSNGYIDPSGENPVKPPSKFGDFIRKTVFTIASLLNQNPTTGAPAPVLPPVVKDPAAAKRDADLDIESDSKNKQKNKSTGTPPPEKPNGGKRISNIKDYTHDYGRAKPVPIVKPEPPTGGKRIANIGDYAHNFGNAKPVSPPTAPTIKSGGAATEILGEMGDSAKFSRNLTIFKGGIVGVGIGFQLWEAYQYSKLIDSVKEWGENYQKNYNAELDRVMGIFGGTVGGTNESSDQPVVVPVPVKPRRSRVDEFHAALLELEQQFAAARERARNQPPEISTDRSEESSSGSSSGNPCNMVPNPLYTPTEIPFGPQLPFIPACR